MTSQIKVTYLAKMKNDSSHYALGSSVNVPFLNTEIQKKNNENNSILKQNCPYFKRVLGNFTGITNER